MPTDGGAASKERDLPGAEGDLPGVDADPAGRSADPAGAATDRTGTAGDPVGATADPVGAAPGGHAVARRRHPRRRGRAGRAFAVAFTLSFVAMAAWSMATPLFAAPDEPVHVIKAAAVVRGELVGDLVGGSTDPTATVHVPAFYAGTRNIPACYHRQPTIPASCAPIATGGATVKAVDIYNARYPPLYYAIVGLPSLLGTSDAELYLMRLVSALLSSLFVAAAVATAVAWSRSRLVVAGVVVATTPMVLFTGAVVNPVGLEASAGIAVWTAGAVLVFEHLDDPPPGLVAVLGASACVLELVRALSPFWLALTALVLVGLCDFRRLRGFVSSRPVQVGLAAVTVVGLAAVAWILKEHAFDVYSTTPVGYSVPESTILETSFSHNNFYLADMIGVFGWFDTYAPTFTYVAWYAMVGFVTLAAAAVGRLRQALVLLAFAVAIVVVPVAISTSQVHRYGFTWAGKDTLVFAVGLPIVSAAVVGTSTLGRHRARIVGTVGLLALLAQVAAFFEMLRRYAVGTAGPDFGFLAHPIWHPPVSLPGVLAVETAALAGFVVLAYLVARGGGDPAPPGMPTGGAAGPRAGGPREPRAGAH
ncbi:MAG TPA: DUF2142 domain-containing protein [Acidimicrobiales bacterium]|nr:DUF2142 domain-containing protein [Acidimicrobiales bacterium]